jgi:hypothetical protein
MIYKLSLFKVQQFSHIELKNLLEFAYSTNLEDFKFIINQKFKYFKIWHKVEALFFNVEKY